MEINVKDSEHYALIIHFIEHQFSENYPQIIPKFFEKLTVNSWKLMLKIQSMRPHNS